MHSHTFMTAGKQPSLLAKVAGNIESDPRWLHALTTSVPCTDSLGFCVQKHPLIFAKVPLTAVFRHQKNASLCHFYADNTVLMCSTDLFPEEKMRNT